VRDGGDELVLQPVELALLRHLAADERPPAIELELVGRGLLGVDAEPLHRLDVSVGLQHLALRLDRLGHGTDDALRDVDRVQRDQQERAAEPDPGEQDRVVLGERRDGDEHPLPQASLHHAILC
jgi:hypothetical protein